MEEAAEVEVRSSCLKLECVHGIDLYLCRVRRRRRRYVDNCFAVGVLTQCYLQVVMGAMAAAVRRELFACPCSHQSHLQVETAAMAAAVVRISNTPFEPL